MAQDPFKSDQFQIEPGQDPATPRIIRRAADGSLEFKDAKVLGGITLSQLAGLRSVQGILVVGKAGAGAAYTTIQAALDAIPATSSATNPYVVLVGPGVYAEDLNIVRDGVILFGLGATLVSAETVPDGPGAYHTVTIQAALGTVPKLVVLNDLTVRNIHTGYACLRIIGGAGSMVAEAGVCLKNCLVDASSLAGNHPLWATSVNHVTVWGGSLGGAAASLCRVDTCASFKALGVDRMTAAQLVFDVTGNIPSEATLSSEYLFSGCPGIGTGSSLSPQLSVVLEGRGSFEMLGCTGSPTLAVGGDRSVRITGSCLGDVTLNDTAVLSVVGSYKGSVTSGATTLMEEPLQRGAVAFVGQTSRDVVFSTKQPDAEYTVSVELDSAPVSHETCWVTHKTVAGFTLHFTSAQTLTASWVAHRVMGGAVN